MKLTSKIATTFAVLALMSTSAHAVRVTGNITFKGNSVLNTNTVNTATRVDSWITPQVGGASGSFASFVTVNQAVSFLAPWTFTTTPANIWSVGGFSFILQSSTVTQQGFGFLDVTGSGTVSGNGFEPTQGVFRFSTQDPGTPSVPDGPDNSFTFSGATRAVPDGGATVALLGLSFLGLGSVSRFVRRK